MKNESLVEELFAKLATMSDAERQEYLKEQNIDDEIQRRVSELLVSHDEQDGLLGTAKSTADFDPSSMTDAKIGPYKIREVLGEGGMGIVYVAEQSEPVRRKVALKVIKPGMDSKAVIARFEAERQAIALMDHPNIAKVLDVGTTESGHPYFVMELVKGIDIVEYCDQQNLTMKKRLDLFVSVCQAIQHAHTKGVIHRDLKPSNILVAPYDGQPVVKVIDFGVAKAIGQQLTEKSVYTQFSQMIGTPLYMSPEQAELNALDVDTRSDVYSLGVLLYELMTGTTPFTRERFETAAFDEIRRIIRDEEPPRPSTRLSTFGNILVSVATQRGTEPTKLSTMVRGDLDWIAMKCLEKERGRRYGTPSELGEDVQRFLKDEPIEARPPSWSYQLRKFSRRHRSLVFTAVTVSVALVAGVLAIGIAMRIAQSDRDSSRIDRDRARELAETLKEEQKELKKTRYQAEQAQAEAEEDREKALGDFYASQMFKASRAVSERRGQRRLANTLHQWRPAEPRAQDRRGWEWFYLNSLSSPGIQTLCDQPPYTACWSPIDNRVVSTYFDGSLRVHDVDDPSSEIHFVAHRSPVMVLSWHSNGRWLATVAMDGELAIWDASSWELIRREPGDATSATWSPVDGRIAIVGESTVRIVDVEDESVSKSVAAATLAVTWSRDGRWLASDIDAARFGILDTDSAKWAHETEFEENPSYLSEARHRLRDNPGLSPFFWKGDRLIAATHKSFRHVARAGRGWHETTMEVADGLAIRFGHWSPESGYFIMNNIYRAGYFGYELYDSMSGTLMEKHEIESESYGGSWTSDEKSFAFSTRHATVYVWEFDKPQPREITRLASGAGLVQWNYVNDRLLTVSDQLQVVSSDRDVAASAINKPDFWSLSADGWSIATSDTGQREVHVHDFVSGKKQFSLESPVELSGLVWSPYNKRWLAALASHGKQVVVWDTETRSVYRTFPADLIPGHRHEFPTVGLAWSKQDFLAVANVSTMESRNADGAIEIWHVPSMTRRKVLQLPTGELSRVVFNPSGTQIAYVPKSWVEVFSVERQSRDLLLRGHTSWERNSTYVEDVRWNHRGDRIATVSLDGTVCIWNAYDGVRIHSLDAHAHYVRCAAWNADSSRLATGDRGGNILIWDPEAGRALTQIAGDRGAVEQIAWSNDSTRLLASFEHDDYIRVFDASDAYSRGRREESLPLVDRRIDQNSVFADVMSRAETLFQAPHRRQEFRRDIGLARNLIARDERPNSLINRSRRNRVELLRCISLAESSQSQDAIASWGSMQQPAFEQFLMALPEPVSYIDIGRCIDAYDRIVNSVDVPLQHADAVQSARSAFPDIGAIENIAGVVQFQQGRFTQSVDLLEASLLKLNEGLSEQELRNTKMRLFKVVYWWRLHDQRSGASYSVWSILLDELGFDNDSHRLPLKASNVASMARFIDWLESPVQARTYFWIALAKARLGDDSGSHTAYSKGVEWMNQRWEIVDNDTLRIRAQAALAVFTPNEEKNESDHARSASE